MAQCLVDVQHPENYDASLEEEAMIRDVRGLNEEMEDAGARFFAGGLESASRAKALRRNFPRGLKPRTYCGAGGRPEGRPFQNVGSSDSTRNFIKANLNRLSQGDLQ
jgi:hypothetical protein